MAEARKIVQNPVLKLLTLPDREGITARGKTDSRVKTALLKKRQTYLIERLRVLEFDDQTTRATHASKVLVWLGIESLSQAPTLTPTDLFSNATSAPLLFAWRDGYVAELAPSAFGKLSAAVRSATTPAIRSDIYGVERLELFSTLLAEDGRIAAEWNRAVAADGIGKLFVLRLPKFNDAAARESVVRNVAALVAAGGLRIAAARSDVPRRIGIPISRDSAAMPNELVLQQLATAERAGASVTVVLQEEAVLRHLVLTGSVAKWEAVVPLQPTIPGKGIEPIGHYEASDDDPIIGVIDGGYHGVRYSGAVAWRHLPALVPDVTAAVIHGNQVSSLTVDAHLWSNQLELPQLQCRIGVVQVVPEPGHGVGLTPLDIVSHIEDAFIRQPNTHVWNLSANVDKDCDDYEVSELGRELARISRQHNKLLVVSAGNRDQIGCRIAPPADCEAAIVVAGREHDDTGRVGGACGVSRVGYGPEGMLKPETSWFSRHRVAGGDIAVGTSFAAPLVSRLAAHTWRNLAEPNPDLVKALLLSACDLNDYQADLGFGSPIAPELPWICPPNAAILAWSAVISAQQRYYWTGIRVPPSLMRDGKFVGKAKLVAILSPETSDEGHHYFQNRLETNLAFRVQAGDGKVTAVPIVGCLNPKQVEIDARRDDNKWDPVRVYAGDFTGRRGKAVPGAQPSLHVYARTFWRDSFKYDGDFRKELQSNVNFVVVLESADPDADTYNEFRRIMAENVVAATVEQNIEIDDIDID